MWDFYVYIVIGICIFFSLTVRVITGFGSAMILAPVIALFLGPKNAVMFIILLESAMAVVFICKERLNFEITHIFFGGISGIVVGIFLFGLLSQRIVGFTIGVCVLTFSILFLLNIHFRAENGGLLFTTLGFLSGSMGVLTGINGPQIVLGLVNQGYDGTFIRRCMITYLIVIDFITLASFSLSGYLTANLFPLLLYSLPAIPLSYIVGTYIVNFITPDKLKRIILITTLFSGTLAIWSFSPW